MTQATAPQSRTDLLGRVVGFVREMAIHIILLFASWHVVFAVLAVGALKGADGGSADIWGLYQSYAPAMWGAPGGEMVQLVKQLAFALFGIMALGRLIHRFRGRSRAK